jgi:hypothetical protein
MNPDSISLISSDSSEYKRFNRRQKLRKATGLPKNPYAVAYNKELMKWEWVIQEILRSRTKEHTNNIIKYPCLKLGYKFKEVDFISSTNNGDLTLVEIKLRESVADKGNKRTGWAQLNTSIELLKMKGLSVSGLAINVDMSFIQTGESSFPPNHYNTIEDIDIALITQPMGERTLYISSEDIIRCGKKLGILTNQSVCALKSAKEEYNDPFINFREEFNLAKNCPFSGLAGLIATSPASIESSPVNYL